MNKFSSELLQWYDEVKRQLPFRDVDDPYKIWLSEIMLQQTQVETVIPYYNKWIKKHPTINSVAEADLTSLLKLWEGLGYYARCRNLHKAAKIIVKNNSGEIPKDMEYLRTLPGVGDYTAAAVMSIAFGKPVLVIDGNVKRVMTRVLGRKKLSHRNLSLVRNRLNAFISKSRPGDFNQALMELGAKICTPKSPKCTQCPIGFRCWALTSLTPEAYPTPIRKKKSPHYNVVAGIIWRGDRFYIQKRDEKGLLGGLWEFPGGKVEKEESLEKALKREIKEECGVLPKVIKRIGAIKHTYTHFSITLHGFHCEENGTKILKRKNTIWINRDQISEFAFPKANHKLFTILDQQDWHV